MRNLILSYVNRTLAMIKGKERKAELDFLRAAQKWCRRSGNLPFLDRGCVRIVDTVSDICDMLSTILHRVRMIEGGNKTSEVNDEFLDLKTEIRQSLDFLEDRSDPNTLLKEVQAVYPGNWGINEDSRWINMVVGDVISVAVLKRDDDVDLITRCVVHSLNEKGSEWDYAAIKGLPEALAFAIVQVVAYPRDWQSFDPALIPDWLKGPLKEALRPEYERIDRMFRGL